MEQVIKRAHIHIDFGQDEEAHSLMENLNRYINLQGWSKKRMFLMGCAEIVHKHGDNPELVLQIANYLEKRK